MPAFARRRRSSPAPQSGAASARRDAPRASAPQAVELDARPDVSDGPGQCMPATDSGTAITGSNGPATAVGAATGRGTATGAGSRRAADAAATPPGPAAAAVATQHPPVADSLALGIARQMRDCSEGDRWTLVHAIRGRLFEARPERVVLCLNALGACHADEGRISKGVYERWRATRSRPSEWPSSQFIVSTFGSWKRAMAAFGADAVIDVLASDLTTDTRAFSREEVLANLREYGDTQLPLTFDRYRDWARDGMGDPARRQPRYIRSMLRINELFGTWSAALEEAGLGHRARAEGGRPRRRGSAADYAPDRCRSFVRAAALVCGGGKMTKVAYNDWAAEHEREQARAGRHLLVPRTHAVCRVFGGWPAALHAAGVIDAAELAQRAGHRTTFVPEAELIAATAQVVVERGMDASPGDYERLRARVKRQHSVELPSSRLIGKRLGGWPRAVALAADQLRAAGTPLPGGAPPAARRPRARGATSTGPHEGGPT